MTNELIVTFEGRYVKVFSNGDKTIEFAMQLWSQVKVACIEHNCFYVLGIANTNNPLKTLEAFNHAKLFKDMGITLKYRIA